MTKKRLVLAAKLALTLLVFLFIGRELYKSAAEFRQYQWNLRWSWLTLAGLFYLTAFFPASCFWHLALKWLGQSPRFARSVKAFYLSQLGKYVPGKAMVVVIRSGLVSGPNVKPSIAAVAVFYETFTMMAVGGFISALIVLLLFREHWRLSVLALLAMLASGLPLIPPLFRLILRILRIGKNDETVQRSLNGLSWKNLPIGAGLMTLLWIFFGLFLWSTIRGLSVETGPLSANFLRFTAVTAMAMVLGFAVPISPGGLGIREAVMAALLIPCFSSILAMPENTAVNLDAKTLALVVSLAQRVVSIIAELAAAGILSVIPKRHNQQ